MSILSKLVSLAFLAPALINSSRENFMSKAKAKSKTRRKSPAPKAKSRAASRTVQASSKSRSSKSRAKPARTSVAAQRAATKRALVKVGHTALSLAKQSTQRAADAGRDVLARATRSAAGGLQSAAHGIGDSSASALQSVANKVMPVGQK